MLARKVLYHVSHISSPQVLQRSSFSSLLKVWLVKRKFLSGIFSVPSKQLYEDKSSLFVSKVGEFIEIEK
jgi:hypothetical protein